MSIIERIDELINEARAEPSWTAEQALRCLRKELIDVYQYTPMNTEKKEVSRLTLVRV